MILILIGAVLLGLIWALFWLKDELRNPILARLAYSELSMRLVVVAVALMMIGAVLAVSELFG
jgi:hypothetical protein